MTGTAVDPKIAYHLRELAIALDPFSPHHILPPITGSEQQVLDVGCGIGQTFAAMPALHGRQLVGLDIVRPCLAYGKKQHEYVAFLQGGAVSLPFRESSFDLVIARVSLPYTNTPRALAEIGRVLRPDGKLWCTLHPGSKVLKDWLRSLVTLKIRDIVFRAYVLLNGAVFALTGRQFPFPVNGRYESFQTVRGMRAALGRAGFKEIHIERGAHFVCTARKMSGG